MNTYLKDSRIEYCPFCKRNDLSICADDGSYAVECINCGAKGPISARVKNAILSWNMWSVARAKWLPIGIAPVSGKMFLANGGNLYEPRIAYFDRGRLYVNTSSFTEGACPSVFMLIPGLENE